MARLPIRVFRYTNGKREELPDHWLLTLMEQPSTVVDGQVWRRDLYCDLLLTGDCYAKAVNPPGLSKGTGSLQRLHPKRVTIQTARGGIDAYLYDLGGERARLDPAVVCHVRLPSFRSDPDQFFYGVGAIQPLNDELNAEAAAVMRTREAAKRGRPDVLISPKEGGLTDEQRRGIAQAYAQLTQRSGGALVLSGQVQVDPVAWSMRDLEFASLRSYTREGILAALAVPPVVMGLETANFATAREQTATFWSAVADEVTLFDSALLTRVLRIAGERDTYAEHDLSGIKALSAWRTEAVQRATSLYFLGVDRDVALASEGLDDVVELQAEADAARPKRPAPTAPKPPAEEEPAAEPEPDAEPDDTEEPAEPETEGATADGTAAWWLRLAPPAQRDAPEPTSPPPWPPEGEEARGAEWRGFVEQLHDHAERSLAARLRSALSDQADRVAEALVDVLPPERQGPQGRTRGFSVDAVLSAIFDPVLEATAFVDATAAVRQQMMESAIRRALVQVALLGDWDPSRVDGLTDEVLAERIVQQAMAGDGFAEVTDTTRAAVRELLLQGLDEGQTIGEMQWAIQHAEAFSPTRALRIARTETTRSVNAGALASYDAAAAELGQAVDRQWLSARDAATRPEHLALDGQTVAKGEAFRVPAEPGLDPAYVGATAEGPGGFAQPGLVCNCRCTVIPVLRAESAKETA